MKLLVPREAPAGRRPVLDPLRSWSPDGAQIAFTSETATAQFGLTAVAGNGRLLVDVVPTIAAGVRLIGWIERP